MQGGRLFRNAAVAAFLLALALSLSHQDAPQARADESTDVEFSIAVPEGGVVVSGCTTNHLKGTPGCSVSVGSSFTLQLNADDLTVTHSVPGPAPKGIQIVFTWDGTVVDGPDDTNMKTIAACTGSPPPAGCKDGAVDGCDIPITLIEPGGRPDHAEVFCTIVGTPDVDCGNATLLNCTMGVAQMNCLRGA